VAAGRVAAVRHDVGDRVGRDDVVATLHVPVSVTTSTGSTRVEYRETSDTLVEVRSPVSGVVVARGAGPNDTVPAGQPILTVVDPLQLWVTANIEETQIRRVQVGQRATVHVDALDLDLEGRVVAITPASAGTFSLIPSQNTTGNYTHVIQLVPVRIALTEPDPRLMIGTSASVRIEVAP
jgi:multidrug resistance efflux pump